ncbi:ribose 5-phosphate isomerase B [Commensalibacter oyaizuii]|uniref:Ribose 5-phosphate isomerase B n=1 Tax=Commensalibacter oyaizuii TaxID=3043873 RepID=A0ABT6Q2M0_9PROT|nr:ribose 5-phosphate isomerase B [Commensalibacter sp. TBRC 16381]MDI2091386.1 ribose 5-phosphate isomerase B [Commensalibacter sp. TBRC 16381]
MLPIAIGCDDAAVELKNTLIKWLEANNYKVVDYTTDSQRDSNLYPDIAWSVCQAIKAGKHERGILVCGTGIGMAITANKVPGIRAAQCHDTFSAERARKSNNAQIITMGARVIGPELAKNILRSWMESEFEGGGSAPKVERISYYEQKGRS